MIVELEEELVVVSVELVAPDDVVEVGAALVPGIVAALTTLNNPTPITDANAAA